MHADTLFFIHWKEKRQSSRLWWFLSCQHFVVWSHWQGDTMPYFTLWDSEDSWNRCVRGLCFTTVCCDLILPISCVTWPLFGLWKCTGLYSQKQTSDAKWLFFSCQLRPITVWCCYVFFFPVHLCFPPVWNGMKLIALLLTHGQFDFVFVDLLFLWLCNA